MAAKGTAYEPSLAHAAFHHPSLVQRFSHYRQDNNGRWGGSFFDTHSVCRACPFAAYRKAGAGDYEYEGFCLLPSHYPALKVKGQARYDEAERAHQRQINANPEAARAQLTQTIAAHTTHKTAAQKGKETRARRLKQKAGYMPNVLAVRRVNRDRYLVERKEPRRRVQAHSASSPAPWPTRVSSRGGAASLRLSTRHRTVQDGASAGVRPWSPLPKPTATATWLSAR